MCYYAIIKTEGIKPFSNYKPKISSDFKMYFEQQIKVKKPPSILVYPKSDKFIMSDDYNSFYSYLDQGYREILCMVLGDPKGKYVLSKSEPFQYSIPGAVIINDKTS